MGLSLRMVPARLGSAEQNRVYCHQQLSPQHYSLQFNIFPQCGPQSQRDPRFDVEPCNNDTVCQRKPHQYLFKTTSERNSEKRKGFVWRFICWSVSGVVPLACHVFLRFHSSLKFLLLDQCCISFMKNVLTFPNVGQPGSFIRHMLQVCK